MYIYKYTNNNISIFINIYIYSNRCIYICMHVDIRILRCAIMNEDVLWFLRTTLWLSLWAISLCALISLRFWNLSLCDGMRACESVLPCALRRRRHAWLKRIQRIASNVLHEQLGNLLMHFLWSEAAQNRRNACIGNRNYILYEKKIEIKNIYIYINIFLRGLAAADIFCCKG